MLGPICCRAFVYTNCYWNFDKLPYPRTIRTRLLSTCMTLHVFVFMFWLKHAFASKEIGTMRAKHEPSSVAHKAKAGERYQANSEQKRADERQRDLE